MEFTLETFKGDELTQTQGNGMENFLAVVIPMIAGFIIGRIYESAKSSK